MAKRLYRLETRRADSATPRYYWHLVAPNGNKMCGLTEGDGFPTRAKARRAAHQVLQVILDGRYIEVDA